MKISARAQIVRDFVKGNIFVICSFIIPFLILGFVYVSIGVFPFGSHTVLVSDLLNQYVDFYAALRRMILGGESPFYSWTKGLGGNFWGISSYYLSSPFSLITLIFPESYLPESIALLTLTKVGAAGLTFALYIKFAHGAKGGEILIFSIPYALMSYVLIYSFNIMWLDGVVFLPLIILGIERIIRGKSFWLYYLSLTGMLIANYYIGYMLCVFAVLYFVYDSVIQMTGKPGKKEFRGLGIFLFSSIMSAGTAAFLLLPTFYALSSGKLNINLPASLLSLNFFPPDILPKLLFGSYDDALGYLPNIYCGIVMLFFCLLFFVNQQVPLKQKLAGGGLLAILLISFNNSELNLIWHGLQPPISFLYRYSFLFSFITIILAFQSYKKAEQASLMEILVTSGLMAALMGYVALHGYKFLTFQDIVISALLFLACFLIWFLFRKQPLKMRTLLFLAVVLETGLNSWVFIHQIDIQPGFTYAERSSYYRFINQLQPVLNKIQRNDNGFYRIEKTFMRSANDPIDLDYKGITHFSSSFDQEIQITLKSLGLQQGGYQILYKGSTIAMDSLLGVKYVLSMEPPNDDYPVIDQNNGKIGNVLTTLNPYALPLGFLVNPQLAGLDIQGLSPLQRQNQILRTMAAPDTGDYFLPVMVTHTRLENVMSVDLPGVVQYKRDQAGKEATIEYELHIDNENPIYLYLLTQDNNKVQVYLNGNSMGFYGENSENNSVISLGKFTPGTDISVKLRMMVDSISLFTDNQFYQFDIHHFLQTDHDLSSNPLKITQYGSTFIKGNVYVPDAKGLLFTSIPFDPGWSITVDGIKVEKIKLLGAFMGFPLSQGEHQVVFTYSPPGLGVGFLISICFTLLAIGISIGDTIRKKNASRHSVTE